ALQDRNVILGTYIHAGYAAGTLFHVTYYVHFSIAKFHLYTPMRAPARVPVNIWKFTSKLSPFCLTCCREITLWTET
ncbi:MAG: hypothetical protein K2G28_01010, partial [Acetatifactor sp.]|nr:hypothetical protein [Acetatifactor sp.]